VGEALAILAYLRLTPRPTDSRDRVVELFWTAMPLPQRHYAVRQWLYRLRQATPGHDLIRLDGTTISCSEQVAFDCSVTKRALCEGTFDEAPALLRRNFPEAFSIPE
jgi:DNA-binding SARP family transcriptional activator